MFGRTDLFKNIDCPHHQTGHCERPYCHYNHDPKFLPAPEPHSHKDGEQEEDHFIGSYSTAPMSYFQGYRGFFDTSDDPVDPVITSSRNTVDSTTCGVASTTNTTIVVQEIDIHNQYHESMDFFNLDDDESSSPPPSSPPYAISPTKPVAITTASCVEKTNINELAKNLASINNAIQELQAKLSAHKSQYGDLTNGDDDDVIMESGERDDEVGSSENWKKAKTSSSTRSHHYHAYKPTPLKELEKMKRKLTPSVDESESELTNMVEDFLGEAKRRTFKNGRNDRSSSPSRAENVNEKRRKSVTTFDLFGENDSSGDEMKNTEKNDRTSIVKKKPKSVEKVKERRSSAPKIVSSDVNIFEPQQTSSAVGAVPANEPSLKKSKIDYVSETAKQSNKNVKNGNNISPSNVSTSSAAAAKCISSSVNSLEKKRIAHANADDKNAAALLRKTGGERDKGKSTVLTPREQLQMRFAQMQKQKELLLKQPQAAVNEKSKTKNTEKHKQIQQDEGTVAGTVPKGEKRIAHVPVKSTLKRPVIDVEIGSKVPAAVRQRYLNLFIDECMKFANTEDEAFEQAKVQEFAVFTKSASKSAYLNACVNAIKRLRDERGLKSPFDGFVVVVTSSTNGATSSVSHETVVGGKSAASCSYSVKRTCGSSASADITGQELYSKVSDFILTSSQLDENGYPRRDPLSPTKTVYKKDSVLKLFVENDDTNRCCCRCGKFFQISTENIYVGSGDCFYHWGKLWKKRVCGVIESRFNCCQGDFTSKGCCVAKYHVTDKMPKSSLDGYVQTEFSQTQNDVDMIFALDCEMIYTVGGTELARVTVINDRLSVVYDRIVKPDGQVLDYNSRFSGLTEADISGSPYNVRDVQTDLLKLFNAETILLGHSLESDLRALKIIHEKVVDTSIVFPHRLEGHKRALKTLMSEYLSKIIQDDIEGHDSKEDACSCMQLMKWKVKSVKK